MKDFRKLTKLEYRMLSQLIGSTASPIDRQTQLAALAYGKSKGIEAECREMIRVYRNDWMAWQFVTQRKWQSMTKNPNKAVHHDSIELREKYVRC